VRYTVAYASLAEQQLVNLYAYIAEASGEQRATNFVSALIAFCAGLTTFPHRGTQRPDIRPGVRTIGFRRRVTVAFEISDDRVLILGIFYGGQDFDRSGGLRS
jgi:toxin ParE1/3/4